MTLFNNTSKIVPYTTPDTYGNGVVLPHSSKVLFEHDIDKKIEKTKGHISHLSNSQSHRNTHGGKRFRARQISLKDQVQYFSKELTLLTSAKEIIVKLNKQSKPPLTETLAKNSVAISNILQRTLGLNVPPAKSYTAGESVNTFFAGKMRTITVLHANY